MRQANVLIFGIGYSTQNVQRTDHALRLKFKFASPAPGAPKVSPDGRGVQNFYRPISIFYIPTYIKVVYISDILTWLSVSMR